MLIMETYRQAKDLPKALQTGKEALAKYPNDAAVRATYALLLGETSKPTRARSCCRPNLKGRPPDRELYLNISQIYERSHRYQEAKRWRARPRRSGRAARE